MKRLNKPKHHLRLFTNNKILNAVLILLWLSVATLGVVYAHKDLDKKTIANNVTNNQPSTSSGTICIAGQPNCNSTKSATSTPSTTTTPSTPSTSTSPQSSNDSTTSDCTVKYLPPPPTTYEDTNLLPQGQTQQASPGFDGDEYICNGKPTHVFLGTAPVVWVGTGTSNGSATSQGSTSGASSNNGGLTEAQAAQQCDENLANGADASDPQAYLDQCMHQYGY